MDINSDKLGKALIGLVAITLMFVINFWVFSNFSQTIIKASFVIFDLVIFVFLLNDKGKHLINKILKIVTLFIIAITLISVATISIFIINDFKGSYENGVEYDFLVIMGDAIHGIEIPDRLANRLNKGAELYLKEKTPIIVTGGKGPGEDIPEAEAMQQYLISAGVPQSDIIIENQSESTQQNLNNVLAITNTIFGENPKPHILIISSDYHLFRIGFLAKNAEMQFDTVPSETPRDVFLKAFVREWFGVVKDFLYVIFNG